MARRSSRFVRLAPRTKMWIGAGVGVPVVAVNTKVLISTLSAGALALRPFTILRTHQELYWTSDQQAATEVPFGSYGKLVVTETAAALGITAVPDPSGINGDPEASWFVWQAMSTSFVFSSAVGISGREGRHYDIDSKAMRKVGPDDDVVTLCTNQSGTEGANLITNGRMFVQLH